VRRAARLLCGRLVYKKIDSTLRGSVGAELVVTMHELGFQKALVTPTFPANGRTTIGGRLLVRDVPLERVGKACAPRSAINASFIPALLLSQMNEPIGLVGMETVEQGAEAIATAVAQLPERVSVVDAETEAHLAAIGQAIVRSDGAWLPVGSAGLAEGLATALGLSKNGERFPRLLFANGPLLVVAGSRSDVTAAQLREAIAVLGLALVEPAVQRLVGVNGFERADEVALVARTASPFLAAGRDTLVTVCFTPTIPDAALPIALGMGRIVEYIMARNTVGGLFLTGGDIAFQVCRALGGQALRPLVEIERGLPASLLVGGKCDGLWIVTKAGGFGTKDAIVVGCDYLAGGREPRG
jgi:uncharacterized protein YgbK (DUF1537 family)